MCGKLSQGYSWIVPHITRETHTVPARSERYKLSPNLLKTLGKCGKQPRFSTWKDEFDSRTGCHN